MAAAPPPALEAAAAAAAESKMTVPAVAASAAASPALEAVKKAADPGRKSSPGPALAGLSLAGFDAVIVLAGGRTALTGKTTGDLKHDWVLPMTRDAACSAAEWLGTQGHAGVAGRANVFVSHAYEYEFLKVVDALHAWEGRQHAAAGDGGAAAGDDDGHGGATAPVDYFYYFDLLVVNQHGQGAKVPFEVLRDEFGGGVRGIGKTLLVLDWHKPVALQRAWCVFEVATSLAVGARFDVIMAPDDEAAFGAALLTGWDDVLGKAASVNVERAGAREPDDLANIMRVIQEVRGGSLRVNQLVVGALQRWMAETGAQVLARITDPTENAASPLRDQLVSLLARLGQRPAAERLARETLELRTATLAADDLRVVQARSVLAALVGDDVGMAGDADAMLQTLSTLVGRPVRSSEEIIAAVELLNSVCAAVAAMPPSPGDDAATSAATGTPFKASEAHIGFLSVGYGMLLSGRLDVAETLLRRGLAEGVALRLPDTDKAIRGSLVALGDCLSKQRRFTDALPVYRRALAADLAAVGPEHPDTLTAMFNLAACLDDAGSPEEALPLMQQCLAGRRRVLTDAHPDTKRTVERAAFLAIKLERPFAHMLAASLESTAFPPGGPPEGAWLAPQLELMVEALRSLDHAGEPGAKSPVGSALKLAEIYTAEGRPAAAVSLLRKLHTLAVNMAGEDDEDAVALSVGLAKALQAVGGADALGQAAVLLEISLATYRAAHGDDDGRTVNCLAELAGLLKASGDAAAAEPHYRELLAAQRRKHGPVHADVLATATTLALQLKALGRVEEAAEISTETLAGYRSLRGSEHAHTLTSMGNTANLLRLSGRLDAAEALFRECWEGRVRLLGPSHASTVAVRKAFSALLRSKGKDGDADAVEREP